jgi:hypothetical protein
MNLQLYSNKIWLCRHAIDFSCSIDRLSSLIMKALNRNRDKIKCLSWHTVFN